MRLCWAGVQERVRREPGTQNACPTCKTAPFIGTDIAALRRATSQIFRYRGWGWGRVGSQFISWCPFQRTIGNFLDHLIFLYTFGLLWKRTFFSQNCLGTSVVEPQLFLRFRFRLLKSSCSDLTFVRLRFWSRPIPALVLAPVPAPAPYLDHFSNKNK